MDDRKTLSFLIARKLLDPNLILPADPSSGEIDNERAGRILDSAVERGLLDPATLASLRASSDSDDPSTAVTAILDDPMSSPGPARLDFPLKMERFGRFTDLEFLGEGGMSVVYRAWDTTLERQVAIKFLRGDLPGMRGRLLLEAKAQARVDHPNVCRIYEASEIDGRVYIAMQLINGKTLKDLSAGLTTEEKARIMAEVADGVHAAHQAGLIHRDMKPSNVMVERQESGRWTPFVMDFGLAREIAAPGVTATGTVVGTASYVPPEQVRGEVLDRRSDVYSLGITLYEILSGTLPFPGVGSLSVLAKVLHDDPVPLRTAAPGVPLDLATITGKCIEKEPGARYESARALSEDLRRFLAGEPIAARPAGLLRVIGARVRRNRVAFAVSVIALVLIAIFATIGIRARLFARTRAEIAQRFGQQVEQVESIMRLASMMPTHDIRPEKQKVRDTIRAIDTQMKTLGSVATGPGHFALGRGYLALGEHDVALEHLQRSWDVGYQTEGVAYALGLALGGRYEQEIGEARRIRNTELREARIREIERTYRDPALDYLRRLHDPVVTAPEYAEALILFYEEKWDAAADRAAAALERVPWLFEAKRLQAEVRVAAANALRDQGEYDQAFESYEAADLLYHDALDISRSDVASWEGRCNLWLNVMWMRLYGDGGDVAPPRDRAADSCANAVTVDPDRASARVRYAEILRIWGESRVGVGEDPSEALAEAREQAAEAIRIAPDQPSGHRAMGVANQVDASWKIASGDDPEPLLTRAIESFREAIRLDPRDLVTFNHLGNALFYRGQHQADRGRDPREAMSQAIEAYEESLRIDSEYVPPLNNAGIAWTRIAEYQNQTGESPLAALDAAIASFDRATAINPRFTYALNNRGLAFMERGKYEGAHGLDARPSFDSALEAYRAAIDVNPDYPPPHFNSALVLGLLGELDLHDGRDPGPATEKALENFENGCAINDRIAITYAYIAGPLFNRAEYALERGGSPEPDLRRARELLTRGIEIEESLGALYGELGYSFLLEGRWLARSGSRPDAAFEEADRWLKRAAELEPGNAVVSVRRAEVAARQAENLIERNRPVRDLLDRGLAEADRAVETNPDSADACAWRGVLYLIRARVSKGGEEREESLRLAAGSLKDAFDRNPVLRKRFEAYAKEAGM